MDNFEICKEFFNNLEEKLNDLNNKINKIDEAIRGNGKEGLNQRMLKIEQIMKIIKTLLYPSLPILYGLVISQIFDKIF